MSNAAAIDRAELRQQAEALASGYPDLLAQAERLAANFTFGLHGRRRSGTGDEFWQYRAASAGDSLRMVDWRRSARSDAQFVRQMEWQTVQSVHIWVDRGQSMSYRGTENVPTKADRAAVLALAASILLIRGGEAVALMQDARPPRAGRGQITRMVAALMRDGAEGDTDIPPPKEMAHGSRAVFISDFLGNWDETFTALSRAADQSVKGVLLQILDPSEASFGFDGRTIFKSMTGAVRFETARAKALQQDYLDRLAQRRADLQALARRTGWHYDCHQTDSPAQSALLWLHAALSGVNL